MLIIEDFVVLKALDESPRFRSDLIRKKLTVSPELVRSISTQYSLNLVLDIYIQGINIETYNSKKRMKLKEQELILIKKINIFDRLEHHMNQIIDEVVEIDVSFTNYFKNDFHQSVDHDFVYQLIFKFIDSYFEEYSNRGEQFNTKNSNKQ